MAYVTVPKDLTRVKSKIVFGLTKRQLICFGGALLVGVPLYFLLRGRVTGSAAALIMVFAMLPGFLLALYERHGQPLEVVVAPHNFVLSANGSPELMVCPQPSQVFLSLTGMRAIHFKTSIGQYHFSSCQSSSDNFQPGGRLIKSSARSNFFSVSSSGTFIL